MLYAFPQSERTLFLPPPHFRAKMPASAFGVMRQYTNYDIFINPIRQEVCVSVEAKFIKVWLIYVFADTKLNARVCCPFWVT